MLFRSSLPASSRPPGPTAVISPWEGFSLALSGMMMPPAGFVFGIDAFDHDAVVERTEFHAILLLGFRDYFLDWQSQ